MILNQKTHPETEIYQHKIYSILKSTNKSRYLRLDDIEYINHGMNKIAFKIKGKKVRDAVNDILAIVIPFYEPYDLKKEFDILKEIYTKYNSSKDNFVPKPDFYIETLYDKIMGMDFIEGDLIGNFIQKNQKDKEELSYKLGYISGKILNDFGYVYAEPHNENIIIQKENNSIKPIFIDVIHFEKGNIEDLIDVFMLRYSYDREEIEKYDNAFIEGISKGYSKMGFSEIRDIFDKKI